MSSLVEKRVKAGAWKNLFLSVCRRRKTLVNHFDSFCFILPPPSSLIYWTFLTTTFLFFLLDGNFRELGSEMNGKLFDIFLMLLLANFSLLNIIQLHYTRTLKTKCFHRSRRHNCKSLWHLIKFPSSCWFMIIKTSHPGHSTGDLLEDATRWTHNVWRAHDMKARELDRWSPWRIYQRCRLASLCKYKTSFHSSLQQLS